VGKAKVQIAKRTAHGQIGQIQMDATAKRLVAQAMAHGGQAVVDFAQMSVNPYLAALGLCAAHPMRL